MVATLALLLLVVVGCLLAVGASGTTGTRHTKDADRRLRWVERHPHQANTGDIAALMRAHELPAEEIDLVVAKARRLGIRPFTMWVWIQQFGVHTLAVVVAADLKHEVLLAHLGQGTLPDLDELEVFAALNGLPTRATARPAHRPVPRSAARPGVPGRAPAARRSGAAGELPVVTEPGSWPYGAWELDPPLPTYADEPGPGRTDPDRGHGHAA